MAVFFKFYFVLICVITSYSETVVGLIRHAQKLVRRRSNGVWNSIAVMLSWNCIMRLSSMSSRQLFVLRWRHRGLVSVIMEPGVDNIHLWRQLCTWTSNSITKSGKECDNTTLYKHQRTCL
jgi:hypothetical protein